MAEDPRAAILDVGLADFLGRSSYARMGRLSFLISESPEFGNSTVRDLLLNPAIIDVVGMRASGIGPGTVAAAYDLVIASVASSFGHFAPALRTSYPLGYMGDENMFGDRCRSLDVIALAIGMRPDLACRPRGQVSVGWAASCYYVPGEILPKLAGWPAFCDLPLSVYAVDRVRFMGEAERFARAVGLGVLKARTFYWMFENMAAACVNGTDWPSDWRNWTSAVKDLGKVPLRDLTYRIPMSPAAVAAICSKGEDERISVGQVLAAKDPLAFLTSRQRFSRAGADAVLSIVSACRDYDSMGRADSDLWDWYTYRWLGKVNFDVVGRVPVVAASPDQVVRQHVSALPQQVCALVSARYGLSDGKPVPRSEAAKRCGLTPSAAARAEKVAFECLSASPSASAAMRLLMDSRRPEADEVFAMLAVPSWRYWSGVDPVMLLCVDVANGASRRPQVSVD